MSLQVLFQPLLHQIDSQPVRQALEYIVAELDEQRKMRQEFQRLEERMDLLDATLEESMRRVWDAIHELVEAQKRTEQRLNELAEAQKRAEERLTRLEATVAELAEAQKRTEERVIQLEIAMARLAEEQRKLAAEVRALAEEQRKLAAQVRALAEHQKTLHERVEGLSNTVGYTLENRAYLALPPLLAQRYGVQVLSDLRRQYVRVGDKTRQVNIYGLGQREGQKLIIVGEAKVRPSRKEIRRFRRLCQQLSEQEGLPVLPVFVAHDFSPEIEQELKAQDIIPIWSYDIDRVLYTSGWRW